MSEQHPPKMKYLSYLLTYLMAVYPMHPAIGAGIAAANGQTQVVQQGEIPVVNIAIPNGAGISHNIYQDFNVGLAGGVLNNANSEVQSILTGPIEANPNLKGGKSADLIINEVIGTNDSQLQGQLEVAGQEANVLIANPNGITCNGCSFVNTPAVTLSTGKPVFDNNGALEALEVKKGAITIGEKGLDATAQDYVDIISRATILNGKVQAKNLALTQGANQVDFKSGTATPITGEGEAPQLSVDTRAVGGMYANKIRLVGTEAGVGINLTNLTTTQDDISLTADGNITLGKVQAKTDININSKTIETVAQSNVQAGRHLILTGETLRNQGQIRAGGDVIIKTTKLDNVNFTKQSNPIITASKNNTITANEINNVGELSAVQNLTLAGKKFSAKAIKDGQENIIGKLSAGGDLTATFKDEFRFDLDKEYFKDGKKPTYPALITGKNITLTTGGLINSAPMMAERNITIGAEALYLGRGNLKAGNHVMLDGKSHLNMHGYDISGRDVTLLSEGFVSVESGDDYTPEGIRALTTISADNILRIISDGHINISSILINRAKDIFLAANEKIEISSYADLTDFSDEQSSTEGIQLDDDTKQEIINDRLHKLSRLEADENIEVHAGKVVDLRTISLTAGKDITLTSGGTIDISTEDSYEYENEHGNGYEKHYDVDEYEDTDDDEQSYSQFQFPIIKSTITAGNNLTINASGDIVDTEATLLAKGTIALTKNNAELHSPEGKYNSVKGKYTPVTSALIARALSHAPQLTINFSEVEGEVPGIKLADKQTRITSKNNRPIIHIAAPNAYGLSHNYYQEFNVGTSGLVFNNSTNDIQSLLAGKIGANLNFNDKSAELIINEVVGTLASNLQGLLEVVGQKANVFIANPNGITCNGCSFVNTPAVTLSTGKPVFDKDGALEALEVKKGTITFGEKGLDATAQDYVDIISRTTKFNGKLQAKNLTLTQGPNQIDFKRGTIVPMAGEDYNPWEAIDTWPLGGIYANKIRLVSTEPGKEVNLANLTVTQGDISLISDGRISLANALTNGVKNIFLASNEGVRIFLSPNLAKFSDNQNSTNSDAQNDDTRRELINQRLRQFSQLDADENIEIHAGAEVKLEGISLTAGKDITLTSGNSLDISKVDAGNNLTMIAGRDITHTKAILSAEGAVAVAENSTVLHSAEEDYTPVTSALIDLGLRNVPRLAINIPEIAGGMPGIKLADKQARVAVRNNLPIVHIAAPNSRSVSHNYYQEFNVGALGLVLNNAADTTQSVLAGPVKANPHFNGKSAELIINEVVGTVASNLQGLLEVVGQKANVFIANPNGITCNGCNFVNTPAVTLSTGKPVFDKDGTLEALEVKKGTITLGEKGLDATAQDYVDIISRAAIFNGKVQAKNLTLTQGPNQVDVKRGTIVPITGEGNTPWKAIDTGSLGGMYANKIRLVSTEVGKAVDLTNLTATQGDISLTADGELSLANTLINRAKNIFLASNGEIEISLPPYLAKFNDNQSSTDSDALNDDTQRELINQRLRQFSQLEADGNIEIHAGAGVNLRGISLTAGKDITLTSGDSIDIGKVIAVNSKDIEAARLTAKQGGISLTASGKAALGDVQAKTDITVNGKDIEAAKLTTEQGGISLTASGKATLGDVQAKMDITVNSKDIETAQQSNMQAGQSLILTTETLRGQGEILAGSDVTVKASNLFLYGRNLKAGSHVLLQGEKNLTVRDTDISGHDITLISGGGGISVSSGGGNSTAESTRALSTISAANTLHILSEQGISLSNTLINRAKNVFLAGNGRVDINQSLGADENIELHAGAGVNLRDISLTAGKDIILTSGNSLDIGKVTAGNNLTMIAGDSITNTTLLAEGETAFAQNSTVLYSAEGRYTPVTSALIDLGLGNAPRLTINIPEIEGEAPGIKLAGKQTRIIVENNHLSVDQNHSRSEELVNCQGDSSCRTTVRDKYRQEYDKVQARITSCTGAEQCVAVAKELRALQSDYSARMSEIQEKARMQGLDSLTPAEVREWADLR
ncbi:filamentous hemagglutinin N-terminal domain-containing protein, partial [Photorhabdus sp. CRCIA-P01]|uniref:filamentous hemagglutinin N-terminal domain-containing protein n=1 Tax=Photorhabdus sp. CRCIA-P01 TaxID=2019570 RepID=UPI000E59E46B